ncbi:MAG: peptide-N4-asparagine amidase [Thermoprotei archaeon]
MKKAYYRTIISSIILLLIIITLISNVNVAAGKTVTAVRPTLLQRFYMNSTSTQSDFNDPFFAFGRDPRPNLSTSGYWSWQDYPYSVPYVTPQTIKIFTNVASNDITKTGYPPLITSKIVNLPSGSYSKILLRVDVQLKSVMPSRLAVNYDRALWIFVDGVPLLIGTTAQRYSYTVISDVTFLYHLLTGAHNFTFVLINYVIPSLGLTGYFVANVTLLYYPGEKPSNIATDVVPLWSSGINNWRSGVAWAVLTSSKNIALQNVTIPGNITKAYLLLYTEGASYDEFWWSNIPTNREVLVYSDSKLIAVSQPFPIIYTGGINPFMWRPVPGINTYAFQPLLIDITPYIPFIIGTHTIKVTITNNQNYWLVGGALLLIKTNTTVSYRFLGDSPQLIANKTTSTTPTATIFNNTMTYTNTASLNITIGSQTVTYKTEYKLNLNAIQSYNDIWWNSTVTQTWYYKSNWLNKTESSRSYSSLNVNYGEIIQVYGDISKASTSNPVPATFSLIADLNHKYVTETEHTNATSQVATVHAEHVTSNSILAGTLVFISPTGAIITGITTLSSVTSKSLKTEETQNSIKFVSFMRDTVGGNYYPPLMYEIFVDVISVKW